MSNPNTKLIEACKLALAKLESLHEEHCHAGVMLEEALAEAERATPEPDHIAVQTELKRVLQLCVARIESDIGINTSEAEQAKWLLE